MRAAELDGDLPKAKSALGVPAKHLRDEDTRAGQTGSHIANLAIRAWGTRKASF